MRQIRSIGVLKFLCDAGLALLVAGVLVPTALAADVLPPGGQIVVDNLEYKWNNHYTDTFFHPGQYVTYRVRYKLPGSAKFVDCPTLGGRPVNPMNGTQDVVADVNQLDNDHVAVTMGQAAGGASFAVQCGNQVKNVLVTNNGVPLEPNEPGYAAGPGNPEAQRANVTPSANNGDNIAAEQQAQASSSLFSSGWFWGAVAGVGVLTVAAVAVAASSSSAYNSSSSSSSGYACPTNRTSAGCFTGGGATSINTCVPPGCSCSTAGLNYDSSFAYACNNGAVPCHC